MNVLLGLLVVVFIIGAIAMMVIRKNKGVFLNSDMNLTIVDG